MVKTKTSLIQKGMLGFGLCLLVGFCGLAYAKIQHTPNSQTITLKAGEKGSVRYVSSGDGFILDDGLKVKLAGIDAPQTDWPEKDRTGQPLAQEASKFLDQLLKGKTVQLFYAGDTRDRFGRAIAEVWTLNAQGEKDVWVQEALVRAGYARVYPWTEASADITKLYQAEQLARKARDGIWNNRRTKSYYKVLKPEENKLAQKVDSLQIIEGVIVQSAEVKGTVYLNFGADYKTDFTIGISKSTRRTFERAGLDPLSLEGARVRVRGWLEMQNGPMIWINTPSRLEIVE